MREDRLRGGHAPTATAASCAGQRSPLCGEEAGLTAALPPSRRILSPACAASGWLQATMPLALCTTERRDGKRENAGRGIA